MVGPANLRRSARITELFDVLLALSELTQSGGDIYLISNDSSQTSVPDTPEEAPSFDLTAIGRVIIRRRWSMLIAFSVTLLAVALYTLRQSKIYSSTCTILIDLSPPKVLDNQVQDVVDQGPGSYWYTREYYETQYKVIGSRSVAARVVQKLHLADDLHFLGLDQIESPVARTKKLAEIDPVTVTQSVLHIEPVKESRVVALRVEHKDANVAAALANAFADAYMAETLSVKQSTTNTASEWLENQLVDLEGKLDKATQALYAFKKQKDIVSTSFEDKQSMVSQRLVALNDALTKTRIQKAQLEARSDTLRKLRDAKSLNAEDTVSQLSNQYVIQQMKLRLNDLTNECSDIRTRYLDQHPKHASCLERLTAARTNLEKEIETGLAELDRQYKESVRTERNLLALYNESKSEAFKVNQYEEEYIRLKRGLDNNQRLYDVVLKRLKDAGLSGLNRMSNVRILDRARPSEKPLRPDLRLNSLLGLILALLSGALTAFIVEQLDSSISSQEEIEDRLGLTFLGILPRIPSAKNGESPELAAHMEPRSAVAECCRSIRTNLLFMSPDKPLRSILITSSRPRDGKTTTAVSLASAMAHDGNRVLLIDADMRRPAIHRVFKLPNDVGLSSLIVGACKLEEAIKSTDIPGLSAIVCGPIPPNPAELLHTKTFESLVATLEQKYDRVILDSPPVGIVADSAVISTQVDGTLLVMKARQTSRDQAKRALAALLRVNARIFGAVLNDLDIDSRNQGYYYYKQYGYYYSTQKDEAVS